MKYIASTFFIAITFLINSGCSKEPDTVKDDILRIADMVATASENKNIENIMIHLSRDLKITLPNSSSIKSFNYESYEKYLSEVFPLINSYKYERSEENIEVLNESEVKFSCVVREKYKFNDEIFDEMSKQTWWLKKDKGKYLIVKIIIDNV